MNSFLAKLLANLLTSAPTFLTEFVTEFEAIAHGEGGAQKVANALQGANAIIATATGVANAAVTPPAA
jgi:hypothetical protein